MDKLRHCSQIKNYLKSFKKFILTWILILSATPNGDYLKEWVNYILFSYILLYCQLISLLSHYLNNLCVHLVSLPYKKGFIIGIPKIKRCSIFSFNISNQLERISFSMNILFHLLILHMWYLIPKSNPTN